jgi:hypothetical protein
VLDIRAFIHGHRFRLVPDPVCVIDNERRIRVVSQPGKKWGEIPIRR